MLRFLKTLLLLFMIALLPLQGMAAVAQTACGMGSHAVVQEVRHGEHHLHGLHDNMSNPHHGNHAQHGDPKVADSHACCTAVIAPVSSFVLPAARSGSERVRVFPFSMKAGGIPSSLDRPPKSFSL